MQDKFLFIVNPTSGNGKSIKTWNAAEKWLIEQKLNFEVNITKAKFHAAELMKEGIEKGFRKFIAVGGDGTIHECVNGAFLQNVVPTEEIQLGILPVGTGNDWIKSHQIPKKLSAWYNYFTNGQTILHDIGKITYQKEGDEKVRYFINIAGLGFEAAAVERACRKGNEMLGGKLYYLLVVAKTLFSYKSQPMQLAFNDGKMNSKLFCVTVGLNRFNGGGMQLLPNADPTDGLLDVAIIEDIGVGEVIINLPKLYNGSIVHHPKVKSTRVKKIEIKSDEKVMIEADGEFLGSTSASIEIIENGIKIMVP